jgi:hypothetical protein
MSLFQRVGCTASVLLLAWATMVFAPPEPKGKQDPAPQVSAELRKLLSMKPGQAVEQIALRAETTSKPVDLLVDVRAARASGEEQLSAEVREALERVALGLERRVLAEGLHEVGAGAERNQWDRVAKKARQSLTELGDARLARDAKAERDSAEFRVHLVEVGKVLGEARDLADKLDALGRLKTALGGSSGAAAAVAAASLAGLDRSDLPDDLSRLARSLRGLAELRAALDRKWTKAPDVAGLKQSLTRFEGGVRDVSGDASLGKKLQQELAVKAALDGHAGLAMNLLPEGGPAPHAANLLRDMRALALGEGKVQTGPALATLRWPGRPSGLEALIPRSARQGWRPPARDSAGELPPLQQAEKVGAAVLARAEKILPERQAALDKEAVRLRTKITTLHNRVMAPELDERRQLAAVESDLDRRLRPVERVKARLLLAQRRTAAQVARDLHASRGDEEEAEFLADVEKRLGKVLDAVGRSQAKLLRKQGRTAAEVADVLRP